MPADLPETLSHRQAEQFLQCFTAHQRRIYLFILALVGNPTDADEVLQETSLVLLRKFAQFEPGSDFRAWACQIARFKVLKFREKRRRDTTYLPLSDDVIDRLADAALAETDLLERRRRALLDCVQKLSARDRDLINRRSQGRITIARIAADVGRPVGGVYKAFERIYAALHNCIESALSGGGPL